MHTVIVIIELKEKAASVIEKTSSDHYCIRRSAEKCPPTDSDSRRKLKIQKTP